MQTNTATIMTRHIPHGLARAFLCALLAFGFFASSNLFAQDAAPAEAAPALSAAPKTEAAAEPAADSAADSAAEPVAGPVATAAADYVAEAEPPEASAAPHTAALGVRPTD